MSYRPLLRSAERTRDRQTEQRQGAPEERAILDRGNDSCLRVATSALVFPCRMIDLVDTVSVAELGLARSLAPQAQFDSASAAAANKVNEKMFI